MQEGGSGFPGIGIKDGYHLEEQPVLFTNELFLEF